MKITVSGVGLLRQHIPAKNTIIEIESPATVRNLVEKLKDYWGSTFYDHIMRENNLAPYVIALLNGLSISMKGGLDTELNDGDRLVFTIMVNGG